MAKDRKIDMVILGLLSHESLTGYDIKKRIDGAIRFFWKGSYGSIYPALAAMETEGLVTRAAETDSDGGSGGREKTAYAITDNGRQALLRWLNDGKASNDMKYETLLKLFFGGSADIATSIDNIRRFEAEIRDELRLLHVYKDNLSGAIGDKEHLHYYLTVTFGIETYEAYLRWCAEAIKTLTDAERQ